MSAEALEERLGRGSSVEASEPENQNRDGWTRYQVTASSEFRGNVQRELEEAEQRGVKIDGTRREVEVMRGAQGQPISELGADFVIFAEHIK